MTSAPQDFDTRAQTWDDDPMKTARAQAVATGIRSEVPLKPGMKGLEFGCGTGLLSFALQADLANITLADTSPGMLEVLRRKIDAQQMHHMNPVLLDDAAGEFATAGYDLIYSLMTLHHIPETDDVLKRFYAWSNQGGHLCIADLDAEDGSFHNHDASVHNGFDRLALAGKAEKAGFSNIRFSTVFRIAKGSPEKEYPVFLMIAEKA